MKEQRFSAVSSSKNEAAQESASWRVLKKDWRELLRKPAVDYLWSLGIGISGSMRMV